MGTARGYSPGPSARAPRHDRWDLALSFRLVHTTHARDRGARTGGLLLVLAAVGLAAIFLLAGNIFGFLDFSEKTIDRSQPPLLNSLTDLSEYRAASANFQVVVDLEKDTKYLPDFIKGQPLAQLYSHAGAFVLPSTHEGLPIALLEALSYGVPTFASDIPANLAVGLEAGSYFPKGDVAAISRCLRHCASLAVDAEARARQRAWVAERYDWSRIARQTLSLYQRTIPAAT